MKVGENIYNKMYKIDVVKQKNHHHYCYYYSLLHNQFFLVVFWGKEKKHYLAQMHLSRSSWVSLVKSNKGFLNKIEHPFTHTQGVLNFYWAVFIVMGLIQTLKDGFISVSVTQSTCF